MIDTVHLYLISTSILGFSFLMAALISMAQQLGEARVSTERIADTMDWYRQEY